MCQAIMGAGCLSLPKAVSALGLVPFGVLIVFMALATHFSIVLLVAAIESTSTRSFEDVTALVIGRRMGHLVELSIIVFQYGTLVAYTIAIGDTLQPLLELDAVRHAMPWLDRQLVMVFFWALFMLPLSFVERISSLQITSLLGQLSIGYVVLAVTMHSIFDLSSTTPPPERMALFHWSDAAVSSSAVIMFAFTCQVNVPSLYAELRERSPAQFAAVSLRAVAICAVVYVIIGIFGYADFLDDTQGNILKNYCLIDPARTARVPPGHEPPRVVLPAFGAITITIVMAYPVNVYPTRYAIEAMCCGHEASHQGSEVRSRWARVRHVGLTFAIATITLLTALVVPDISVVFSLMGGTCSAFVCYIIPSAVSWKLAGRLPQNRTTCGRIMVISLGVFGMLVGVLSTATTIKEMGRKHTAYDACHVPTHD